MTKTDSSRPACIEVQKLLADLQPFAESPAVSLELLGDCLTIDWQFAYHFDTMFLNITFENGQYLLDYQDLENEEKTIQRTVGYQEALDFAKSRIRAICG